MCDVTDNSHECTVTIMEKDLTISPNKKKNEWDCEGCSDNKMDEIILEEEMEPPRWVHISEETSPAHVQEDINVPTNWPSVTSDMEKACIFSLTKENDVGVPQAYSNTRMDEIILKEDMEPQRWAHISEQTSPADVHEDISDSTNYDGTYIGKVPTKFEEDYQEKKVSLLKGAAGDGDDFIWDDYDGIPGCEENTCFFMPCNEKHSKPAQPIYPNGQRSHHPGEDEGKEAEESSDSSDEGGIWFTARVTTSTSNHHQEEAEVKGAEESSDSGDEGGIWFTARVTTSTSNDYPGEAEGKGNEVPLHNADSTNDGGKNRRRIFSFFRCFQWISKKQKKSTRREGGGIGCQKE
ncbi:uncharacterized protein LOC103101663 isoform X2 [Monodelphis domestica]|uniref:uncharacterized protein LOC103101663 isoform X2 n=1 Tax=Monodelphis domestica TaxID=13616 RepID=UPI000443523A|nr:uncharacterized protein LOC103101663 isoform X2 [Monodelphis domestica]